MSVPGDGNVKKECIPDSWYIQIVSSSIWFYSFSIRFFLFSSTFFSLGVGVTDLWIEGIGSLSSEKVVQQPVWIPAD